jgi:hypothetical protein
MFFVIGRGRSGALLLSRALMRHPEVVVVPESGFLVNLHPKYGHGHWSAHRVEAFCRDLLAEDRMRAWSLDVERLRFRLAERAEELTYAEACRQVYTAYARDVLGASPAWIGDRTARNALCLDTIERVFPDARYLHITRDYRDNIRSYRHADRDGAMSGGNTAALAQRWLRYNQAILRLSRRAPDRVLWLRYEDLCAHPEQTLARVHGFLGLGGALDTAQVVPRPSCPEPPQRCWEHELPARVIEQAESVCGSFAELFGYQPCAYRTTSHGFHPASLAVQGGRLLGESSLWAERLAFRVLPTRARIALSNACDRWAHAGQAAYSSARPR